MKSPSVDSYLPTRKMRLFVMVRWKKAVSVYIEVCLTGRTPVETQTFMKV